MLRRPSKGPHLLQVYVPLWSRPARWSLCGPRRWCPAFLVSDTGRLPRVGADAGAHSVDPAAFVYVRLDESAGGRMGMACPGETRTSCVDSLNIRAHAAAHVSVFRLQNRSPPPYQEHSFSTYLSFCDSEAAKIWAPQCPQ